MSFEKFKEFHNSNYHDGDSTFDGKNYSKSNGEDFDNCFVQDCYDHFEAGAQSRQAEINELQKRIDEGLNKLCQLQYTSAERVYSDVSNILKGSQND